MKPAHSKTKAKTKPTSKIKKPRRKLNVPKVVYGAGLPKPPELGKEFDLKERGKRGSRIVEFPQLKGREIQTVHFYSSADENTISIAFRDQHVLSLHFEPALVLTSSLLKLNRRDTDILKECRRSTASPETLIDETRIDNLVRESEQLRGAALSSRVLIRN
jgi:hypothetical protein